MTWTTDVMTLIDDLRGGTLRKLDRLANSPPTGRAAFAAWRQLETVLGMKDAINPLIAAERVLADPRDPRSTCLVQLVRVVLAEVERALDAGEQDAEDGIYRLRDFPHKELIGGGRGAPAYWGVRIETVRDWQNGDKPGLRPDHPLRSIPPIVFHDGQKVLCVAISADVDAPYLIRASAIARNTAAVVERMEVVERERDRAKAAQERDRIEAATRLEREAEAIRRGVVAW